MKPTFLNVALSAVYILYQQRTILLQKLAIPFVVLTTLELVQGRQTAMILLQVVTIAFVAIITHRIVLLGPNSVPKWGICFSLRETIFSIFFVVVALIFVIVFLLASAIAAPLSAIHPVLTVATGAFVAIYITARISLVMPAIAVDHNTYFSYAWTLSKNHKTLMNLVIALPPILLGLPYYLLELIPLLKWAVYFWDFIATVITVAVLSTAYKSIYDYEASNSRESHQE